jgi:MICOS complex subunit MIC26
MYAKNRKPIYDDFEATTPPTSELITPPSEAIPPDADPVSIRGPTPTDRLAAQIRRARLFLYRQACVAEDGVNRTMDRAFHLEKSFTDTIASLAPPRESGERLMPGTIYVLVAAMAGSILTRRSNILLRATVPLGLGVGAGYVVLPITMRNIGDLAWQYESRFPAIAKAHISTRESIEKGWMYTKMHAQLGKNYAEEKVSGAREGMEDWVKKGK